MVPKKRREREGYYKQYYEKNKDAYHERYKRFRLKLRKLVIEAYGGKCACCGYSDIFRIIQGRGFLQIDHINGNGNKERRRLGLYSGIDTYLYLKHNGFPSGYRVLCGGCNVSMEPSQEKCELHRIVN